MPLVDEDDYFSIGKVVVPGLFEQDIKCNTRPAATELDFLAILCEHVNSVISYEEIVHRIGFTYSSMSIWATHLNNILHPDWWIHSVRKKGFRILYIGGLFRSAERSYFVVDYDVVRRQQKTRARQKLDKFKKLSTRIRL